MRIKVMTETEVELKTLHVDAGVRYWEDATVNGVVDEDGNLIPFRKSDCWCPIIELETGRILSWPEGTTASIHYKVCDSGNYYINDIEHNVVLERVNDYVPDILSPGGNGYGDYIIMEIDEKGYIKNWSVNLDEFKEA